ncbi:MAG: metallophosphoesterase family protein [Planctomycetota bacterium]|jgi:predicted phosphodiesterase
MQYAILADIHGNLEALNAVIGDCRNETIDEYLCLGDIVGYGADPEECVNIVRDMGFLCVAGNHDHASIGRLDISLFNQYARDAALWTAEHLSERSVEFLLSLSFVEHLTDLVMVHGSLQMPESFNYIQTVSDAEFNFKIMDKPLCLCGHSHVPLSFFYTDPMTYSLDPVVDIDYENKTIINVGSVGQPRDERPEASYAVYDTDKKQVFIRRVVYDIEKSAEKITAAGLPKALAMRLWLGK